MSISPEKSGGGLRPDPDEGELQQVHRRIRWLREPGHWIEYHGIELELRFWISDPQEGVNNVRSEVNRTIWALFKMNNITIPVAQREIYVHNLPSELD